ncbi:MAG: type III polyketide synthase, partial [Geobacteraceae bacterium]|nr:type III polyketide synthase [Geobacteraceae bacterium]
MPRIIAVAHALPPHTFPQQQIRETIQQLFTGRFTHLARMLTVFDHSRID